ncbi:ATP synthase F1 subunit gamma [Occallatibacter riparius]|uniref:ATP synthase gamma chain n=1 Tax=Occallatibacter riparius TaxID=1002689 RepID=A0A9J7BMC3_9BACT|nr:ATP synthase F1 subunit gamma [Occallatibacter riparius]UWZ83888.1 ATP synthase F1 subunit gamma [Occallatibacter riparius]
MANVLDLRRRIRSVKNTRQITKAMKMVSAAKLRRAQERALAARPYAQMISSVLESLTRRIDIFDPETGELRHPLFITRPEKRVLLIVISGDKGFAGAFNANILKASLQYIEAAGDKQIDIEAIGKKGRDLLRRRYPAASCTDCSEEHPTGRLERKSAVELMPDHPGMLLKLEASRVFELAQSIVSRYVHEDIDAAYIVYNEFKSVIAQRLVVEKLLPLIKIGSHQLAGVIEFSPEELERAGEAARTAGVSLEPADTAEADEEAKKFGTANVDYIYEQSPEELFNGLLPQYIASLLYHAMSESVAAEQAARMTAMDSATNNATDMIDAYTLQMNRVRQAAITKEIIEIVSGAAAV